MTATMPHTDLDRLAQWVAERLDRGDDESAWEVTAALEEAAGVVVLDDGRPSGPVIGRRFSQAHARLSARGEDASALEPRAYSPQPSPRQPELSACS